MQNWFPNTPIWSWSLFFIILIFLTNFFSVKIFAETEFFFSLVKVLAIILFIILGSAAIIGILPYADFKHAPGLSNLTKNGWFPNGFGGVFTTMLTVNFAFSGTELIGITAGEAKDPQKTIPQAIHTTLWRLVIFFIGSIVVMSALIPYEVAGVTQSPFVYVLKQLHLPFVSDLMNFVVLMAIISAANSGLYASTRMLWSLGNEQTLPATFTKTSKNGVPVIALCTSMLGAILALISSVVAADTVYLVLVSISGLAVVIVWMTIALSQLKFRKAFLASGHQLSELKYKTPLFPFVPWFAFSLSGASCLLIWFDPTQRIALYWTIPFVICCYLAHYLFKKRK